MFADSNFDRFREERERAIQELKERSTPVFNLNEDFNLNSFETYLRQKFPERPHAPSESLSALLKRLNDYHKIDNFIEEHYEKAREIETQFIKDQQDEDEYKSLFITTKKDEIIYFGDTGFMFTMVLDFL